MISSDCVQLLHAYSIKWVVVQAVNIGVREEQRAVIANWRDGRFGDEHLLRLRVKLQPCLVIDCGGGFIDQLLILLVDPLGLAAAGRRPSGKLEQRLNVGAPVVHCHLEIARCNIGGVGCRIIERKLHRYPQYALPHLLVELSCGLCLRIRSTNTQIDGQSRWVITQTQLLHSFNQQRLWIWVCFLQGKQRFRSIVTIMQLTNGALLWNETIGWRGQSVIQDA